jgi:hypothetical protein
MRYSAAPVWFIFVQSAAVLGIPSLADEGMEKKKIT